MKSIPADFTTICRSLMQNLQENIILCQDDTIIETTKAFLDLIDTSYEECIGSSLAKFVKFQSDDALLLSDSANRDYLITLQTSDLTDRLDSPNNLNTNSLESTLEKIEN